MIVLFGIGFPKFGAFVLSFVPIPDWVNPLWVRLAMLAVAIIASLIVGVISLLMLAPQQRPK